MDLNLSLGTPYTRRRLRGVGLGSDLALSSPPSPAPSSPSSSTEESSTPPVVDMPGPSGTPPGISHAPYSPSRASIMAIPDPPLAPYHRPPFARVGWLSPHSRVYMPAFSPPPLSPSSGAPDAPYTLSNVMTFPADHDSGEGFVEDGGGRAARLLPYDPLPAAGLADELLLDAGGGGSPSYIPLSVIPEDHEDLAFAPYQPVVVGSADIFEGDDGPSLTPDFLDPEFRLGRLIELQHHSPEGRPPQLPRPNADELRDYPRLRGAVGSDGSAGVSRKSNMGGEGIDSGGLEGEKGEKNLRAVNFVCNICLDLAQEPVVTSCGHLFCWPCLYQWLHLHCNHRECPVCKGEVIESNITPIYGCGNPETRSQEEGRDGDPCLKIPPRPCGHRIEGWRQRIRRPISRRFSVGIASTWRRVLVEGISIGDRVDGDVEANLQDLITNAHHRVTTRLMARRSTRVEDNVEHGSSSVDAAMPPGNAQSNRQSEGSSRSIFGDAFSHWPRFSFGGSDGRRANLSRIFGRHADSGNHSGASASSGNPQNTDDPIHRPSTRSSQAMDQAPASSTMAVIQGDGGIVDVATEPNSAGSSRSFRRRGRGSSSLDVDGCALHARKRRRLN
uniref:E3 ubiquitin-protein ligase RMA n=1 Tax=Anthurium amnicola TaxID=1678845 RepID=A0A1D1YFW1_9ARAE